MTIRLAIEEADTPLPELCEAALMGEEVVFRQSGAPVAKLVLIEPDERVRRLHADGDHQGRE